MTHLIQRFFISMQIHEVPLASVLDSRRGETIWKSTLA